MTAATESFLREIEEAITLYRLAVCNDLQNITHERVAARAALLAAIEKYAEDALAASRAENAALARLVEVAKCPNCDGSGVIVVETTGIEPGCCGHPNRDGSCCGNAIPVQTQEQEQQPCQWCDERAKALRAPQTGGANDGQT